MARVGQAAWQAAWTSFPPTLSSPRISDAIRVSLIRCTQYVHFSITPRGRTVTSGLRINFRLGVVSSEYWKKLNRRTLYGQLFAQYRVPTQRLYVISLSPSALWVVAATGQTISQGAVSQCMQATGWKWMSGSSAVSPS